MRRFWKLSQLKVRDVAVIILLSFFVFLVYTHGGPTDDTPARLDRSVKSVIEKPEAADMDFNAFMADADEDDHEDPKDLNNKQRFGLGQKATKNKELGEFIHAVDKTEFIQPGNFFQQNISELFERSKKEAMMAQMQDGRQRPRGSPVGERAMPGGMQPVDVRPGEAPGQLLAEQMPAGFGPKPNGKDRGKPKMNQDLEDPDKALHFSYINTNVEHLVHYKKDEPIIWVTGHPRSGTTLMRAMLDAHESVRCGEETHIIPRILGTHQGLSKSPQMLTRLRGANINAEVINNAVGAYIMTVIAQHGEPADRLCNKDPMTITNAVMITDIFPKSKILFMIRDGRAVSHSIITRGVPIQGFDRNSYRGAMKSWNRLMTVMYKNCQDVGADVCLPVYYEQLVLHPKLEMKRILDFLGVEWSDAVLKHHEVVGKAGGVSLSKNEFSTDQVEKPVNLVSLTSWASSFPQDAIEAMRQDAPLLEILGYDPDSYPPNYGIPDEEVLENTKIVKEKHKAKQLSDQ